jgi:glutathione peroxidase
MNRSPSKFVAVAPICFLWTVASCGNKSENSAGTAPGVIPVQAPPSQEIPSNERALIFDSPIKTLDGKPTSLAAYRGKALLLVNVASRCGLTPQYEGLEQLEKRYAAQGFEVLGFPCNQFAGQEPGSPEEIKKFCSTTYGVTFPIFEKIEVNGAGRHAIYNALTRHPDVNGQAGDVKWNFEKFVVTADGTHLTRFRPNVTPEDPTLIAAIEAAIPTRK